MQVDGSEVKKKSKQYKQMRAEYQIQTTCDCDGVRRANLTKTTTTTESTKTRKGISGE